MTHFRLATRVALLLAVLAGIAPAPAADRAPMVVTLADHAFVHRWSKNNQNEFTPEGQADLGKWKEMVTLNLHPGVRDGEQLAALANSVLGNYQRAGKIMRTASKPRSKDAPAEHLIVALLGAPGLAEAAFARVMLVDGVGMIAVYSRRAYGGDAAQTLGKWLQANGPATEKNLLAWKAFPRPAALKALPQSK